MFLKLAATWCIRQLCNLQFICHTWHIFAYYCRKEVPPIFFLSQHYSSRDHNHCKKQTLNNFPMLLVIASKGTSGLCWHRKKRPDGTRLGIYTVKKGKMGKKKEKKFLKNFMKIGNFSISLRDRIFFSR